MADGPIGPSSISYPTSGRLTSGPFVGSANSRTEFPNCIAEASLGADSVLELRIPVPQTWPGAGTDKLEIVSIADATSGNAKINPSWASMDVDVDTPDTITLNAEGITTITWGSGDDDQYKRTLITLDADTVVAGEDLIIHVTFVTASWTLAAVSGWYFRLINE